MLNEETIQKLINMKLLAMAAMLREMATSPPTDAISIEETIGLLVDHEWTARENRRLERLLKDAHVPPGACIEDLACDVARGIDKAVARSLASCQWVRAKQNVIVLGATESMTFCTSLPTP
jgi:DNA replication protein DnaC